MRNPSGHAGKSKSAREYYTKAIKHLDYEPTLDESLKFPESDDTQRDYSVQKSPKRRKPTIKQQFLDHWEENWVRWLIAGVGIVLLYLMVDSKIAITAINGKVDNIKEEVTELKQVNKSNQDRFQQQELKLQEQHFRISSIEWKCSAPILEAPELGSDSH